MDDLHIVTVVNESKYYFPYLEESCERNGKELEVLGLGEKWTGFNFKYKKMVEYLKTLPENDIVCFVDGYDVICVRDLNDIKEQFLEIKEKTGCKMIVGHDKLIITELLRLFSSLYFGNCDGQYLNSGTYIGYVKDVFEILIDIIRKSPNDDADDQKTLTEYCNKNPKEIYIDKDNEVFLAMAYPNLQLDDLLTIKDDSVIYNGKKPFFLHAMAGGNLENTLRKLGYSINDDIKNKLYYDNIKKSFSLPYRKFVMFIIMFFLMSIVYLYYFHSINKVLLKIVKRGLNTIGKID
jgi:hypothetical protein